MLVEALGVVALQGGVEQLPLLRERLSPAQPLLQDHVVRRCRVEWEYTSGSWMFLEKINEV